MKYIIHACNDRMWYVEKHLIPSMTAQGIPKKDIKVWQDKDGAGNLASCMACFKGCGKRPGGAWHLQDDVVISNDFTVRTKKTKDVTCGFCCEKFETFADVTGETISTCMWYSFPCIYIPNSLAAECADWFYNDVLRRGRFKQLVREGKFDDELFRRFILERHPDIKVTNLAPNLVDHIDYLIGGSVVNMGRPGDRYRALYWEEPELVDRLEAELNTME